jgi:hypothetical protein
VQAPLLGRDDEIALLEQLGDDVLAARGRALFVVGEPGIGKSTLLAAFAERADLGRTRRHRPVSPARRAARHGRRGTEGLPAGGRRGRDRGQAGAATPSTRSGQGESGEHGQAIAAQLGPGLGPAVLAAVLQRA